MFFIVKFLLDKRGANIEYFIAKNSNVTFFSLTSGGK